MRAVEGHIQKQMGGSVWVEGVNCQRNSAVSFYFFEFRLQFRQLRHGVSTSGFAGSRKYVSQASTSLLTEQ